MILKRLRAITGHSAPKFMWDRGSLFQPSEKGHFGFTLQKKLSFNRTGAYRIAIKTGITDFRTEKKQNPTRLGLRYVCAVQQTFSDPAKTDTFRFFCYRADCFSTDLLSTDNRY